MKLLAIFISVTIIFHNSNAYPVNGNHEQQKYFIREDLNITRPDDPPKTRMNVDRNKFRVWPQAIVPYIISKDYTQTEINVVLKAMKYIESVSCVRFQPRGNLKPIPKDFIHVTPDYKNGYNCYSAVGRQGGEQLVKMQKDCVRDSAMTHELIHAIGFGHENQRPDARTYIDIIKNNIDPAYYQRAYEPYPASQYTTNNKPYDYYSIMHYPDYAYAKPGAGKTMIPKKAGVDLSYERTKISPGDVAMIKEYYSCK